MATKAEKIAKLTDLLYTLSAPRARKQPYDLKAIAESLLERYDINNPKKLKQLPIFQSVYKRPKAWSSLWYWERKIKDSGNFQTMIDIIKL